MSANESNPVDAFQFESPARRGSGVRSIAGRALLVVFGFFAALAAIALLVMATISQMQWQKPPADLHDKYLPARPTAVPPANRQPTPADVGEVDPAGIGAPQGTQPQFRPGYSPGFQPPPAVDQGEGAPTPSYTTVTPPRAPARPGAAKAGEPSASVERTATPAPRGHDAPAALPAPAARDYRRVAGKTFKQRDDGFLVDTEFRSDAGLPVVEVKAGSPEYTRLLDEHKDLAQYFRLSDRLILLASSVCYRVVP